MIGVLLLSHGKMAEGLLDTSKFLFGGNIDCIQSCCLEMAEDIQHYENRVRIAYDQVNKGDGVVILCDLLSGTPCNVATHFINDETQVIVGMNFIILLELLGMRLSCDKLSELDIDGLIEIGKNGLLDLNKALLSDDE